MRSACLGCGGDFEEIVCSVVISRIGLDLESAV